MIRHASARLAGSTPVLPLPVTMIEPPFRALLVPFVGLAPLLTAGLFAAFDAAIAVSAIAVRADEKHRMTASAETRPLEENCFVAMNRRHALSQAGLDNGVRFVAG